MQLGDAAVWIRENLEGAPQGSQRCEESEDTAEGYGEEMDGEGVVATKDDNAAGSDLSSPTPFDAPTSPIRNASASSTSIAPTQSSGQLIELLSTAIPRSSIGNLTLGAGKNGGQYAFCWFKSVEEAAQIAATFHRAKGIGGGSMWISPVLPKAKKGLRRRQVARANGVEIFIRHLALETTQDDLRDLFSRRVPHVDLVSIALIPSSTGFGLSAFLKVNSLEEAQQAVDAIEGEFLNGVKMVSRDNNVEYWRGGTSDRTSVPVHDARVQGRERGRSRSSSPRRSSSTSHLPQPSRRLEPDFFPTRYPISGRFPPSFLLRSRAHRILRSPSLAPTLKFAVSPPSSPLVRSSSTSAPVSSDDLPPAERSSSPAVQPSATRIDAAPRRSWSLPPSSISKLHPPTPKRQSSMRLPRYLTLSSLAHFPRPRHAAHLLLANPLLRPHPLPLRQIRLDHA